VLGLFPHIFINGQHQFNNSWTFLLRSLCGLTRGNTSTHPLSGCQHSTFNFGVEFNGTAVAAIKAAAEGPGQEAFLKSLSDALDFVTSSLALPHHFDTDDDTLPPG
jgi:hypothetical protein